jgi:butyryl-CoA dehydrogenase
MAIEFTLDSDQRRLRAAAREIAHDVLAGVSARAARLASPEERFAATRPAYRQLVEAGYLRKVLPEPAGGELRSTLDLALIAEELTAVDASVALTLFAVTLGLAPVVNAGTAAQQRAHLAKFLTPAGTPLAAFALSEPGGSANFDAPPPAEGVRTTAVREAGHWVIAGAKKWVSNSAGWDGTGPDLMSVVARTDPAATASTALSVFLVTGPVSGLSVTGIPDTIGHRAHSTPAISLADVRVPEGNVVGDVGGGLKIVGSAFAPAAAQVGVFGLALMRAAFDYALRFAQAERRGGPVPIIDHQAVGYALASAKTRIEAVRSLTWRACHALDTGSPAGRELALHAKVFGSETAVAVITDLMQVVGVDSYAHERPLGRLLQDALALPLFGGSNLGLRRRQLHAMLRETAGVWRTRRTSPGCSARPTACHRGSSGRKRSPWPDRSGSLSGHGGRIGEDPQREPPGPGAGRPALVASRVVPGCVNPRRGCWRPAGRETCRILRLCLSNLIIQVNPKRRTLELSSLLGVLSLFSRCDRGRDRQSGILCLTSRPTELT